MSSSATTSTEIPKTMKRLVVKEPGPDVKSCKIEIETIDVPIPKSGQVLIKVIAAAVNPSDYGSWKNCKIEQCPFAMGKEGCGIVVQSNMTTSMSLMSNIKVGSHVGFIGLKNKQGSYSEYVVADGVSGVFTLPNDLPLEDAASFFVNPYTAIGILDTVKHTGSKAFIHTAAASQLGQMLVKLTLQEGGIEIINVVRRQEQADILIKLGAKHVVVTDDDDEDKWKTELQTKATELNCTVAMDAVAGKMSGNLLEILPPKSTVFVYGGLAGKVENVNPMDLIYKEKQLKGFYLTSWIEKGGMIVGTVPRLLMATRKVIAGLGNNGWSSSQFQDTTMEKVQEDTVKLLESTATGIKLRVRMDTV